MRGRKEKRMTVSERVDAVCEAMGWDQNRLAAELGVAAGSISNWKSANRIPLRPAEILFQQLESAASKREPVAAAK